MDQNRKHAYLIMAHNEFGLLKRLLHALDDERNDIYLHIDKKTIGQLDFLPEAEVKKSRLVCVKSGKNSWGHLSLVKCEYRLLEAALPGKYLYYHLISGMDFPIKSQKSFHEFLDASGKDYVAYHTNGSYGDEFLYKIAYYYPFLRWVGKGGMPGNSLKAKISRRLGDKQYAFMIWQKEHGVDRLKRKNITYYKGNQWFSICHKTAQYVVSQKRKVLAEYRLTNGADEIFLPTLLLNSEYKDNLENNSLRLIDWKRGTPYEFREQDYAEIVASPAYFVRKVSLERSPALIEQLEIHNKE